jgi:hypothetical protein
MPSIKLTPDMYHAYVEGQEVSCHPPRYELHTGDHVMVFKDTLAATSSISVPNSTQQSQAIGVEGVVVQEHSPQSDAVRIKKL